MKPGTDFIVANGTPRELKLPCTIAEFLISCGFKSTQVVVEHNGTVLARSDLPGVVLKAGDRLEVIVPVAGG